MACLSLNIYKVSSIFLIFVSFPGDATVCGRTRHCYRKRGSPGAALHPQRHGPGCVVWCRGHCRRGCGQWGGYPRIHLYEGCCRVFCNRAIHETFSLSDDRAWATQFYFFWQAQDRALLCSSRLRRRVWQRSRESPGHSCWFWRPTYRPSWRGTVPGSRRDISTGFQWKPSSRPTRDRLFFVASCSF